MATTAEERCTYCDNPAGPATEAPRVCLTHCAGNTGGTHAPDWGSARNGDVEVERLRGDQLRVHVSVQCQHCQHWAYAIITGPAPASLGWNPS